MIGWLCPNPGSASGGVAMIHRLARLADQNGLPSRVIHEEPFDFWWDAEGPFDDIITRDDVGFDTAIIPEITWQMRAPIRAFPGRKIVFIQNYAWACQDPRDYADCELLVVSRHLYNWCTRVLDKKPLGIVSPYTSAPWRVTPKTTDKTLVIARRNPALAQLVAERLAAENFPVHFLTQDVTQAALADIFDSCEFYVHLSHPEGIPWLAAEAMLSGTIVCGTTGGGGVEFMFDGETAMVVQDPPAGHYSDQPDGGQVEFSDRIMEKMRVLRAGTDLRSTMWQTARNWVAGRYTRERTIEQLKTVLG